MGNLSHINILNTFPLFKPYSAGDYASCAKLTIDSINQTIPALHLLAGNFNPNYDLVINIETLSDQSLNKLAGISLKKLFDSYGSDKSQHHNYHHVYGMALSNPSSITNILEIGMGTNNLDIVSNMTINGRPGASLRAFRDFCPNANIYGADVDKRILFSEERIQTFFVDQTKNDTFIELSSHLPKFFDLIIDDGLHSPNANLLSLNFGLRLLRNGGWFIIEDINQHALPVWFLVNHLLPNDMFQSFIFKASKSYVYAVKRKGDPAAG
jgi:SAM-dependent methyltransferase